MVEVLVAAVGQADLSLREKMNIRCDCLIANQNGTWGFVEEVHSFGKVRMISTATRGVGINRNLALSNAVGDILLLADDDVRYYEGAFEEVEKAFRRFPDADVIAFGMDMTRGGKLSARRQEKPGRRRLHNSMRFGACRLAIRRSSVLKHGLSFSELFGGGCMYSSGEDTIFLRECFRKGLKVYASDYVLGTCARDSSTWFNGYTDKYYFDQGALMACVFPYGKHALKWYFARNLKRKGGGSMMHIIRCMNQGIKAFPELRVYTE